MALGSRKSPAKPKIKSGVDMAGKVLQGSRRQQVEQATTYTARIVAHAVELGLDPLLIDRLQNAILKAEEARDEHYAAMVESKARTQAWKDRGDEALEVVRAVVKIIKARAQLEENPELYVLSGIPVPDTRPTPGSAPERPHAPSVSVSSLGFVELTWKGTRSTLISTHVFRRLEGERKFTLVGAVSGTNWSDTTVPPGTRNAAYYLVAHRKGKQSEPTEIVAVNFGQYQVAA